MVDQATHVEQNDMLNPIPLPILHNLSPHLGGMMGLEYAGEEDGEADSLHTPKRKWGKKTYGSTGISLRASKQIVLLHSLLCMHIAYD